MRAQRTRCFLKHYHPSRLEAEYCDWLYAREQRGEIAHFLCQFAFPVSKTKAWKADFVVLTEKADVVETHMLNVKEVHEAKGFSRSDDNFRFKLALFFERYPGIPVFVNKRRVYPSESGKRILNLPRKTRKRPWPKRLLRSSR